MPCDKESLAGAVSPASLCVLWFKGSVYGEKSSKFAEKIAEVAEDQLSDLLVGNVFFIPVIRICDCTGLQPLRLLV
ncbi:MAG: hypothetical protein JKY62_02275 [Desulfocapsa sp.]|nr:hypothetical protein [Desulfocapsa sp.]